MHIANKVFSSIPSLPAFLMKDSDLLAFTKCICKTWYVSVACSYMHVPYSGKLLQEPTEVEVVS